MLLLLSAAPLRAQSWLDSMRGTDLNDYALGVMVSTSGNPFDGASAATVLYPYLTQLQHSAFNKSRFILRDGDAGFRYVTDSEWEFGVVGRVQTLGLGATDNPAVVGLADRRWSLEAGPMIGWRGWPVHFGLKAYTEILGRHDGFTGEFSLSLPLQFDWGYVVPSLELVYLDDDYADYYYGVAPIEDTPTRPEYQPGSALNPAVVGRLGYRLGSAWLVTAKLGLEFLDAPITDSPIVDKDKIWSASVGVAYNANLFRPRKYDASVGRRQSVEVRVGAFSNAVDSSIRRVGSDGSLGDEIDVENVLGIPERETAMQLDLVYRLAYYHRFEVSYFSLSRHATNILDQDIEVGDSVFPAGSEVSTQQDSETLRLQYGYSLIRDSQKEFGVLAGLHYTKVDSAIAVDAPPSVERLAVEVPLPTLGAFGSVAIGQNWKVVADAQLFALEVDRYEGSMFFAAARLERRISDMIGVGAGFNYYSTRLEGRDSDLRGLYKAERFGPVAYVSAVF